MRAVSTAKFVLKPGFPVESNPRQGNMPATTGLEGLLLFAVTSLQPRFCNDPAVTRKAICEANARDLAEPGQAEPASAPPGHYTSCS